MKITRGQLRAFVNRTQGYVDELECELEANEMTVTLKFHHLSIEAMKDGRYQVTDSNGLVISSGAIEPVTNEGWFKSALDS